MCIEPDQGALIKSIYVYMFICCSDTF